MGEPHGDAAHHQAPEPPHPPAADDHEPRAGIFGLPDDLLDGASLPEVRPGDRAALVHYPPHLRVQRLAPGAL